MSALRVRSTPRCWRPREDSRRRAARRPGRGGGTPHLRAGRRQPERLQRRRAPSRRLRQRRHRLDPRAPRGGGGVRGLGRGAAHRLAGGLRGQLRAGQHPPAAGRDGRPPLGSAGAGARLPHPLAPDRHRILPGDQARGPLRAGQPLLRDGRPPQPDEPAGPLGGAGRRGSGWCVGAGPARRRADREVRGRTRDQRHRDAGGRCRRPRPRRSRSWPGGSPPRRRSPSSAASAARGRATTSSSWPVGSARRSATACAARTSCSTTTPSTSA